MYPAPLCGLKFVVLRSVGRVERATGAATQVFTRMDNIHYHPFFTVSGHCQPAADGRFGSGLFQTAPERADGTNTEIVHTLAEAGRNLTPFYFDNRNFRNREGDLVPYKDVLIPVPSRINIANDFSRRFVVRDSPQVATRVPDARCTNSILKRDNTRVDVLHCGGVSRWLVASGGRMGMVTGEDATEVAPGSTNCVKNCQAQNRVRGRAVSLGFPFMVNLADRLKPRFP